MRKKTIKMIWKGSDKMDFSKLNIEFSNMQNMITKYNELLLEIKNKIKNNFKEISKYETKMKNTKNNLEKECYKILVISLKNETLFLESIIKEEEKNESTKELARMLLKNKLVTFVGSDAHRTTHRPPNIKSGVDYIYQNCDGQYADDICFRNAERYLLGADK